MGTSTSSTSTSPAASSAAASRIELIDPNAYKRSLFDRVGHREPLDVLAETPTTLAGLVRGVETSILRRRPYEHRWTWTPIEVIGHLVDTEIVFAYRTRTIFADDEPVLVGMDQDKWVAALGHGQREARDLVRDFADLRRINLAFWRTLRGEALQRVGKHAERGPERLGDILRMAAGHDLAHIEQFNKYIAAIRAAAS